MNKQMLSFNCLMAMLVLLWMVPVSAQVIKGNVWTAESLPQQGHITGGPWTLQQRGASNAAPSAGYCINGVPQSNPGTQRMSPYYFAFVTNSGKTIFPGAEATSAPSVRHPRATVTGTCE